MEEALEEAAEGTAKQAEEAKAVHEKELKAAHDKAMVEALAEAAEGTMWDSMREHLVLGSRPAPLFEVLHEHRLFEISLELHAPRRHAAHAVPLASVVPVKDF